MRRPAFLLLSALVLAFVLLLGSTLVTADGLSLAEMIKNALNALGSTLLSGAAAVTEAALNGMGEPCELDSGECGTYVNNSKKYLLSHGWTKPELKAVKKLVKDYADEFPAWCILAFDFVADVWSDRVVSQSPSCNNFVGKVSREHGGFKRGKMFKWTETITGITQIVYAYRTPGEQIGPFNMTLIDRKGNEVPVVMYATCRLDYSVFIVRGQPAPDAPLPLGEDDSD